MGFIKKLQKLKWRQSLITNMVTILFVVLCFIGFKLSGLTFSFYLRDLIIRAGRNSFLILALIIPVLAGMGLNFAIVIGAMAGQIAIIIVTHWGINGIVGVLACFALATPLAIVFGYLIGRLLNETKGQEMITSLVLGFFANGVYMFVLLILVGSVIPMNNPYMLLSRGFGIKNTIGLGDGKGEGIKYGLDGLLKWPLSTTLIVTAIVGLIGLLAYVTWKKHKAKGLQVKKPLFSFRLALYGVLLAAAGIFGLVTKFTNEQVSIIPVPIMTFVAIAFLSLLTLFIVKTKLGQDFRAVGMDMHVAKVAGINVDKTRIMAIIFSIVIASWGQIIFLQNLGNLNTYGSHGQVGMFAIAAILIGGASVAKATVSHAILGALLFHTLFIVSPLAGRNVFGDAQIGEFFRAFVAYGVIALSLVMHAWRKQLTARNDKRLEEAAD